VAGAHERDGPVRGVRREPGVHFRDETPRAGAIVAHASMQGDDGILEHGELQALLGLEPGRVEERVAELAGEHGLRLELAIRSIGGDPYGTRHRHGPMELSGSCRGPGAPRGPRPAERTAAHATTPSSAARIRARPDRGGVVAVIGSMPLREGNFRARAAGVRTAEV